MRFDPKTIFRKNTACVEIVLLFLLSPSYIALYPDVFLCCVKRSFFNLFLAWNYSDFSLRVCTLYTILGLPSLSIIHA
jgi:hypothetical protein